MIRADLLYDQLKGRRDLTGLQTRLVFIVHARRMRMKLLEVEIAVASATTEHNQKLLLSLSDQYRDLMFPGIEEGSKKTSFEEQAKALLAKELKKVYRVSRIDDPKAKEREMAKIMGAGGAGGAMAAQATLDEQRAMTELRRRGKG